MSTPKERGFLFCSECVQLLSQDHAYQVDDSTITAAIQPPEWWEKEKNRTGTLPATVSPPSLVWEVDLQGFEEYRQGFHPGPRTIGNPEFQNRKPAINDSEVYTIAEAADFVDEPRSYIHRLVYTGNIPSVRYRGFRFIRLSDLRDWWQKTAGGY